MNNHRRRILALAGGAGGGKLARGLIAVLSPESLAIVVNTADDFVHLGLHIAPDIDAVLYALADLNDPVRGWGLSGETWNFMAATEQLGSETWFRLGDRDVATHILRTQQLNEGRKLSEVTSLLASRLGIKHRVAPMSDDPVRSVIDTDEGPLPYQEYFVRRQYEPAYRGVRFEGVDQAQPSSTLRAALHQASALVITPSNPFVSIDPILALQGVDAALRDWQGPVVAVSPIVGGKSVKGALGKMMDELGVEKSPTGIAKHYGRLVDGWIIDTADKAYVPEIEALGCRVKVCNTMMWTIDDKIRLARDTLALVDALAEEPAAATP